MTYTFTTPELPGRIVYADESYEMNENGDERVAFTEDEMAEMMRDPRFGYVCQQGHRIDQTFAAYEGGCRTCYNLHEARCEDEYFDEVNADLPETGGPIFKADEDPFAPDDAPF